MKEASYIPVDITSAVNNHGANVQGGETCRVDALKDVFAWQRGFVNAWYGWSNDGKGTFFDYMAMLKSKYDKWKWCLFKHEDMDTVIIDGKPRIKANRIYHNLAWTLTGKTWNIQYHKTKGARMLSLQELTDALDFISDHFYVINPQDRKYTNVLDEFRFMHEKFGIDGFLIDPWNTVVLPANDRGDERLINAFIDIKEFAMITNTVVNIVNHPKSMTDVKEKDGRYKVVNQFMQLGGSAWDIKMDGQYSIYRPERHLSPSDPKVHFYNLKQRAAEIVGVERGEFTGIIFDKLKKQYYFDGVNPMDGSVKEEKFAAKQENIFQQKLNNKDDEPPF